MKNKPVILLSIILLSFSCGLFKTKIEKMESKLIGKWNLTDASIISSNDDFKEMEKELKKGIKENFFKFNKDKTCEIKFDNEIKNRNWEVNEEGKYLLLKNIKGDKKDEKLEIKYLKSDKLNLLIHTKIYSSSFDMNFTLQKEK